MRRTRLLLLALILGAPALPLAVSSLAITVRAAACTPQQFAGTYPNDPRFAPAERGQAGQTWDSEDWYLYGCTPSSAPLATDPQGVSGMRVADLWNRSPFAQRGRDDVVVAYMEGGINWRIPGSCELKDRAALNTGELPYPENAAGYTKPQLIAQGQKFTNTNPYDLNDDGVVNVEDWVADPRVLAGVAGVQKTPPGGPFLHHVCSGVGPGFSDITPEDLIVAFGHCQVTGGAIGPQGCPAGGRFDNDHNGYPNDINGWNFNRDNNDPQTEQSIYEHFTGESAQAVGEGNNGFDNVGMCPLCRYIPIKAGDEAIDRPDRVAEAIVYAADMGVSVMDVTSASLGLNPSVQGAIDYAYRKGTVVVFASNDFESADHTDGMYYAHVWPGNSLVGDHSTRLGATCPVPPSDPGSIYCPWVKTDTTFLSRSTLTSYGPHALFSVPNNDGSTSTGTPTQAGVAALLVSEGRDATSRGQISGPLTPNEVQQVVRSTAQPVNAPCPAAEPCFTAPGPADFNIQYGYGRPDVLAAAAAIDANHIPPTADIQSPSWYQWVDPTRQSTLRVTASVAARRAAGGAYTWEMQYGLGPQPLDTQWTTFATGSGGAPATVAGTLHLSQIPASFWGGAYSVDPATRLSIEQYDVTVRVRVFANGDSSDSWAMGEDRRAFHLRHDSTEIAGFPLQLGASGEASPTLADIEGRGWLDTIVPTSDGRVHAIRPDGTEAPGFPVSTGPAIGMNPAYAHNYLSDPVWRNRVVPRPGDEIVSALAVGDLKHTGELDIVGSTLDGRTWAWDGSGHVLAGFPKLNGSVADYSLSVPPPDSPCSFAPENVSFPSPVLADLEHNGNLDIVQAAGDNHVYAWRPDGDAVPGWPVPVPLPGGAPCTTTHDSKVIPTPAIVDINGDGIPDVVVGLDDSILGTGPNGAGVKAFLLAYDGRGTKAGNNGLLPGYPVQIPGLIQGYGVAQDFVTQGVESPAVYDTPAGPQAVVNANLFAQYRVDLRHPQLPPVGPFQLATIPAAAPNSCPTPTGPQPGFSPSCTLVPFTTSASLGKVVSGLPVPQVFQAGSSAVDVLTGVTQTPGFGIRVDNGVAAWDPSAAPAANNLANFNHYIQGLGFFAAPAIADVTGDGVPDVLIGTDSSALMGFDSVSGQAATGFPKWTGGWSLFTPATGDVNGSGSTDVAEMTREGYLSVWSTAASACTGNNEAWHWHQDDRNTGHYGVDTRPPSAIADLTVTHHGASDTLTFTAVGDNWMCGTAASYQLFTSASPITQHNVSRATPIAVTVAPQPAGTRQTITIPAALNQGQLAIRAIDAAGNIGPLPQSAAPSRAVAAGFAMAWPVGVAPLGLAPVLPLALRRRRLRAAGPRSRST